MNWNYKDSVEIRFTLFWFEFGNNKLMPKYRERSRSISWKWIRNQTNYPKFKRYSRFDAPMLCTVNLEILVPINFFDGFILPWWLWTNSDLLSYRQLWATLAICINPRWRSNSIPSDIKVAVTQKLSNRIQFAIARFHGNMTGLTIQFEISIYYSPKWLPKFKMAEKTQKYSKKSV